ncbi:MAG: ribonuclease Y [bacterium]|nr:ribonuclease Y [bacterium]
MQAIQTIALIIVGIAIGGVGIFLLQMRLKTTATKKAEDESKKLIEDAKKEAEHLKLSAQFDIKTLRDKQKLEFDDRARAKESILEKKEKYLDDRESNLERRANLLTAKQAELSSKETKLLDEEKSITTKTDRLNSLIMEENRKLEKIAGMTEEEAKQQLFHNLEEKVKDESKFFIRTEIEKAKLEADREARKIVSTAIERCATEHIVESAVAQVALPSDEMKGRIIGREGRNIKCFETLTGTDLLIDDTPGVAFISSMDPIRREIAKMSLERLLTDGRIHPARIEELVKTVEEEFPGIVQKIGEETIMEMKVSTVHPELVKLLGYLKFRTSYGQNVLIHSKEVANLAYLMATELELPEAKIARRAGLLHDIGKALSQEYEGTHQKIGADIAKRYGETDLVVNAIEAHHRDIPATSIIAVLVEAADSISGARPGARRETFEAYVERLEKLESIVTSFDGVGRAYAIQAGREVRVMVEPEKISDESAFELANSLARKIEQEMKYPGEIKVTVIRETRAVTRAK